MNDINFETGEVTETALTVFPAEIFINISAEPVTDEQANILMANANLDDLAILPTGEVYLPQAKYRQCMNRAFKPGGWAMRPLAQVYVKDDLAMQGWMLYVNGQFMAYAVGGAEYRESNQRMNWSDVLETVKSNALMRLCKDLGIVLECWDKRFIESFRAEYCIKVWVDGSNKPQWRRLDSAPFYKETGTSNDSPNQYPDYPKSPKQEYKAETIAGRAKQVLISNSPQALVDEVNAELGQDYYKNPEQAYNTLGKYLGTFKWPKLNDIAGWKTAKETALLCAREQTQILTDLAATTEVEGGA